MCLEALFIFAEDGMALLPFVDFALAKLVQRVYLLSFEQLCRLSWVALNTLEHKALVAKILERLQLSDLRDEQLVSLNFKDFSYLIWTLAAAPDKQQVQFVFDAYENLILAKNRLSAKAISQALWAVTLKYRLKKTTYDKLVQSLLAVIEELYLLAPKALAELSPAAAIQCFAESSSKEAVQTALDEIGTWEIMNLIWGVSRFESADTALPIRLLAPVFLGKLEQFTCTELLMVFRVYAEQDFMTHPSHSREDAVRVQTQFYDPLIDQLAALSAGLRIDEISIIMFYLLKSPQLQYKDHTATLKHLFEVQEEKKKKIEVASSSSNSEQQ